MVTKHHNCEQSSACQEQSSKRKLERKELREGKRVKYLLFNISYSFSRSVSLFLCVVAQKVLS